MYDNDLYVSPNDVCAHKNGGFWISNDAGKRNSMIERILKLKRANVVYTDANGNASKAADKMAYANGISYRNNNLFVSTTMQGKLFQFDIDGDKLINRKVICEVLLALGICPNVDNLVTASICSVVYRVLSRFSNRKARPIPPAKPAITPKAAFSG